jgi:hypothetical protein
VESAERLEPDRSGPCWWQPVSVASILQQLAQQAGQRHRARGALVSNAITDLSQVPGQIIADREQARVVAAQRRRQGEQDAIARDANARANADQYAQDAAGQLTKETKAKLDKVLLAYHKRTPNDVSTNDPGGAKQLAIDLGIPEAITVIDGLHDQELKRTRDAAPKLTEFNPAYGSQDPQGNVVRQPSSSRSASRVRPKPRWRCWRPRATQRRSRRSASFARSIRRRQRRRAMKARRCP